MSDTHQYTVLRPIVARGEYRRKHDVVELTDDEAAQCVGRVVVVGEVLAPSEPTPSVSDIGEGSFEPEEKPEDKQPDPTPEPQPEEKSPSGEQAKDEDLSDL